MLHLEMVPDNVQMENTNQQLDASLWMEIFKTGIQLPIYLKNLLRLTGFDNIISFQKLNYETLQYMEHFAKENIKYLIDGNENPENYYGIFHKCPENFHILEGHKILLLELASRINANTNSVSDNQNIDIQVASTSETPDKTIKIETIRKQRQTREVEKEKMLLRRLIIKWLITHGLENIENVELEVSLGEMSDFENAQGVNLKYRGTIICPFCKKAYQAHKMKIRGSEFSRRWITSNFQKHIKTNHMTDELINGYQQNETFLEVKEESSDEVYISEETFYPEISSESFQE